MSTHPDPEQLSAYIDGELPDRERDDLEQHLTGCADCSATLRALRATRADMRAMSAPVPSEQESWALRAAINKARRRPATRYRRWTVAAGSVAAVAAAVVVFVNVGQTSKSTFGNTATAPQNATAGNSPAALIEVDPKNYTPATALQLVIHGPVAATPKAGAAPAGTTNPAPSSIYGGAAGTEGSTFESAVTDAQRTSYLTGIQGCEQQVLPAHTSNRPVPLRYIVGTFEGTPVYFLLYSVTAGTETKFELWVVQRVDCYIRYFVPPR